MPCAGGFLGLTLGRGLGDLVADVQRQRFFGCYRGAGSQPMTFAQLSSYIWLQQAFLALFMMWFFDNDIFEAITRGDVAYELCRPVDLYNMWFVRSAALRTTP